MKLENQVCSLELAKRLDELGVKQESLYWWSAHTCPITLWSQDALEKTLETHQRTDPAFSTYSAFTVAELGEMLPKETRTVSMMVEGKDYWLVNNIGDLTYVNADSTVSEADARAKMLVYLLENGLLDKTKE